MSKGARLKYITAVIFQKYNFTIDNDVNKLLG